MRKSDIRKALGEYNALSQQIVELEKKKAAVADKIKRGMGEREELEIDGHTIRYKEITTARFDAKAFRAVYDCLYKDFCRPQTVRRFSVA